MNIYNSDELDQQKVFTCEDVADFLLDIKRKIHDKRMIPHLQHRISMVLSDIEDGSVEGRLCH